MLGLDKQHPLFLAPAHPVEETHAEQGFGRIATLDHRRLDAQQLDTADLHPVRVTRQPREVPLAVEATIGLPSTR